MQLQKEGLAQDLHLSTHTLVTWGIQELICDQRSALSRCVKPSWEDVMKMYRLTACLIAPLVLSSPADAQDADFRSCPRRTINVHESRDCLTYYAPLYVYARKIQKSAHIICQFESPDTQIYVSRRDSRGWLRVQFRGVHGYIPSTVVTPGHEEVRSFYDCRRPSLREGRNVADDEPYPNHRRR